ncbi:hypothetical protein KUV51_14675 [Tateyamaria omphalii]|uniref:hypothetical protein n=1 Tax=Tateyamaria omphalii TaxID=299262 RepID=UPI001C99CAE9|nr:hypothetical protein [Tateyamaria omphalii]MBY5934251.1 hypothetical protein [Tateyamaria omphalii]
MSKSLYSSAPLNNDFILKVALHSGALMLAYFVTWELIMPGQRMFMTMLPTLATLFYLPFGIKVISAFFEGWRCIIYMAPGIVIGNFFWVGMPFDTATTYITWLASYGTAPAIFAALDWATQDDRRRVTAGQAWRTMIAGGAAASVAISVLVHVIRHRNIPQDDFILSMLKYMIGDMLGLLLILAILMGLFRYLRKVR